MSIPDPTLQFSKKAIPKLSRSIDIYQHDLHTAAQDAAEPAGTHPNDGSNVASVTFPVKVALGEFSIVSCEARVVTFTNHDSQASW